MTERKSKGRGIRLQRILSADGEALKELLREVLVSVMAEIYV